MQRYKGPYVGKPITTLTYDNKCDPGSIITDIYGSYTDKLSLISYYDCSSIIDVNTKKVNPVKVRKTVNIGTVEGLPITAPNVPVPPKAFAFSCPVGSSFIKADAFSVKFIDTIQFACADFSNNVVQTFPRIGAPTVPIGAKLQSNVCSNQGERFCGIYGFAVKIVDSFGVYCAEAGQISATQTAMRAQAELVVGLSRNAVTAKNSTVSIATAAQTTLNTLAGGFTANSNALYNQLVTSATQSNTSAMQAQSFYDQAVAVAALVTTDTFAMSTAATNLLTAKNAATDATTAATNTALYAVTGKAYMDAYVAGSLAQQAVAAKNAAVTASNEGAAALNSMASTPDSTTLQQIITAKSAVAEERLQSTLNFEAQTRTAAAVVDPTVSGAVAYAVQAVQLAQAATAAAQETVRASQSYIVSAQALIDASAVVAYAAEIGALVPQAQEHVNNAQAGLEELKKQPDSAVLVQGIQSRFEQLTSVFGLATRIMGDAFAAQRTVSSYALATNMTANAITRAQASIDLIAAMETTVRDMYTTAQAYFAAAPLFALAMSAPMLEKKISAFRLQVELLTITANNAVSPANIKVSLDQATETGRNMLGVVDRLGALIPQADELLAAVRGDEMVINLARNARTTIVTNYEFARAAYGSAQALLRASQEIYNNTVATDEAFRQSMVASGRSAMDTIVADAAKALQVARSVNDSAKRILSQIEFATTKSPEALVLLTQLDDNARVVNMAAATIEADILLAQQVQLDYIEFISFERALNDMGSNAQVARELSQATSAMATRARELTMQKIASETSTLESYKQIEKTATTTVLPQMRMQKEEFMSKFAAAEAAFRSIQALLRGATATRLHVSSSSSVEISELLQTLVAAYDAVNLVYKDILFLYESNVAFLNSVISSNLSFTTDTTFQQRASQTLQELLAIKNTAQTSLSTLETWVSNARKTLSDTIATENAEAERVAAEKAVAERLAAEQLAAEKAAADRLVTERLEAERLLIERLAAEKAKSERLAAEQLAAEKAAADRLVTERLEAERLLIERLAAEKAKAERLTAEQLEAENYNRRLREHEKTIVNDKLISGEPTTNDKPKSIVDEKWFLPVVIVVLIVVIIAFIVGIAVYRKQSRKSYM
jgi:hypothetical protein